MDSGLLFIKQLDNKCIVESLLSLATINYATDYYQSKLVRGFCNVLTGTIEPSAKGFTMEQLVAILLRFNLFFKKNKIPGSVLVSEWDVIDNLSLEDKKKLPEWCKKTKTPTPSFLITDSNMTNNEEYNSAIVHVAINKKLWSGHCLRLNVFVD